MTAPLVRSSVIGRVADADRAPRDVEAFTIAADGIEATIWTKGATLASLRLPDGRGGSVDITDGPADLAESATKDMRYAGASIGRFANRLAPARFTLDGTEYVLVPNEGENQLHGGPGGFHSLVWEGRGFDDAAGAGVRLHLLSPSGDQGYPGTMAVTATFTLSGRSLTIDYLATTDAPTVVNLTNHAYWNLAGRPDDGLRSQFLAHGFDSFIGVDDHAIPIAGAPLPLADSRFEIRPDLALGDQLSQGGIDHCFVGASDPTKPCLVLSHPESGRRMSLTTDQPGVQIYTGNHLAPTHRSVAFEPQRWPNAPNRPDFGPSVLRPGEVYRHRTRLSFDW